MISQHQAWWEVSLEVNKKGTNGKTMGIKRYIRKVYKHGTQETLKKKNKIKFIVTTLLILHPALLAVSGTEGQKLIRY